MALLRPGELFQLRRYLFNRREKAVISRGDSEYQHGLLGPDAVTRAMHGRRCQRVGVHLATALRHKVPVPASLRCLVLAAGLHQPVTVTCSGESRGLCVQEPVTVTGSCTAVAR